MIFTIIVTACSSKQQSAPTDSLSTPAPANDTSTVGGKSLEGNVDRGAALFKTGHDPLPACSTCHSTGHDKIVGPGLGGLSVVAGQRVPGQSATDYIQNSIINPSAYIRPGFENIMPPIFGTVLSDQDIADLIAYLMTLP
ncbi:MAG: c-type cytochrome [Chloroflexota bacterium]